MKKRHWLGTISMLGLVLPCMTHGGEASASEAPLAQEEVCHYINTRIETNLLQEEFKRTADQYADVPRAYFKARNDMLREQGWTVDEFEAAQRRILDAVNALEEHEEFAARAEQGAEEKARVHDNDHLSDEQKRQMLEMQDKLHQARKANIDRSRPDWPAVRPHRELLKHLTAWIAGNTPDQPAECTR